MFDFSFAELLLIVVVAVIFIGPKDLPVVVRAVARFLSQFKAMAGELKTAFDDLAKESGLHEAEDTFRREVKMIAGDDGEDYESYDISDLTDKKPHA